MNYHDAQPSYSQDTFNHSTYSLHRGIHNSARTKYVSPEEPNDIASGMKGDRVDKPFPIKPVYHKRTLIIDRLNNDDVACKPNELQRLPPQYSSPLRAHSEYVGRNGLARHRKPAEDPSPSMEDYTNSRRVLWSQPSKDEKQKLDFEHEMAKKIDKDKLKLQEKLLKTLGSMHQGRVVSGDNTKRERDICRQLEREKEWNFRKASSTVQRTKMERDLEMERKDGFIVKPKKLEDSDWQREKEKEFYRERREMESLAEKWENLGRMEREMVNKSKGSREKRQDKLEGDMDWERVKRSERNMREREIAKEVGQNNKVIRNDIYWNNKWERSSRERHASADDMRRERDISHRRLVQEGLSMTAPRSVPESSSAIHFRSNNGEASQISPTVHHQSSRLQQLEFSSLERTDNASLQLIPCRICHRKFTAERLEKHHQVCERTQQSRRKVFDSSRYRAKGTDLEAFMKTNSRSKSPVLPKSTWRQKHQALIHNLRQARVPAEGASQPQPIQVNSDYVTCPHCVRRFAPGPAERHIPKCENIKSRPPPPRNRH